MARFRHGKRGKENKLLKSTLLFFHKHQEGIIICISIAIIIWIIVMIFSQSSCKKLYTSKAAMEKQPWSKEQYATTKGTCSGCAGCVDNSGMGYCNGPCNCAGGQGANYTHQYPSNENGCTCNTSISRREINKSIGEYTNSFAFQSEGNNTPGVS
jgi:hypothetical protein